MKTNDISFSRQPDLFGLFTIFATLSRARTKAHENAELKHLNACIVLTKLRESDESKTPLKEISDTYRYHNPKALVSLMVVQDFVWECMVDNELTYELGSERAKALKYYRSVTVYLKDNRAYEECYISLTNLVKLFNLNSNSHLEKGSLEEDIYNCYISKKDKVKVFKNFLFKFQSIPWFVVVLRFKLEGIEISGGTISKRHMLQVHQVQLISLWLMDFTIFYRRDVLFPIRKLIPLVYDNFVDPRLSPKISLDMYRIWLGDFWKDYIAWDVINNKEDFGNNMVSILTKKDNEENVYRNPKYFVLSIISIVELFYNTLSDKLDKIYNDNCSKLDELKKESEFLNAKIVGLEEGVPLYKHKQLGIKDSSEDYEEEDSRLLKDTVKGNWTKLGELFSLKKKLNLIISEEIPKCENEISKTLEQVNRLSRMSILDLEKEYETNNNGDFQIPIWDKIRKFVKLNKDFKNKVRE